MLQILAQNSLVILKSWSETMDIGILNMYSICSKKSLAKSLVEVLVWVGINQAALVLWYIIIKIELSFLPVLLW
jgi:hypothetical protein